LDADGDAVCDLGHSDPLGGAVMTMPLTFDHPDFNHLNFDHLSGEALDRVLEQKKKSVIANAWRTASLLEDSGDLGMALVLYNLILALDASHTQAHLGRGAILMQQGRLLESVAAFEEAARLDPADCLLHTYLAQVWTQGRQTDAAAEAWRLAERLDPVQTPLVQEVIHRFYGPREPEPGRPEPTPKECLRGCS
jgi:tetratricopeptide (TPR) repeat protein